MFILLMLGDENVLTVVRGCLPCGCPLAWLTSCTWLSPAAKKITAGNQAVGLGVLVVFVVDC